MSQQNVNVLSFPVSSVYKSIVNVINPSLVFLNNSPNTNNAHQIKTKSQKLDFMCELYPENREVIKYYIIKAMSFLWIAVYLH